MKGKILLRNCYEGKAMCSCANKLAIILPRVIQSFAAGDLYKGNAFFHYQNSASDAFVIVMTTLICVSYVINPAIGYSIGSTMLAISARGIAHSFQTKVPLISLLSLLYEFLSVSPSETPQGFEVQLSVSREENNHLIWIMINSE